MLDLLKVKLLKTFSDKKDETTVFYLKMCGDYYRYLAEFRSKNNYTNQAKEFYGKAMGVQQNALIEIHPTHIGLVLNFTVCYYQILKEIKKHANWRKNLLTLPSRNKTLHTMTQPSLYNCIFFRTTSLLFFVYFFLFYCFVGCGCLQEKHI